MITCLLYTSTELTDEYIKKVVVSGNIEHNQTILLKPYDDKWPVLFEREKNRISKILKERALMIEHIGSTSVPGLTAKPIIDILLVVEDAGKEELYVNDLCEHGYILRIKEPDFENHHMFKGSDTDINLHVFSKDSKEIEKYLLFRNYLRLHDDARELYENTKKELVKKTWKYVQNYADAKSEVVQKILSDAIQENKTNQE